MKPDRRTRPTASEHAELISETETAIINCHFLAGDLLDLAGKVPFVDADAARMLSMALTAWAHGMAQIIEGIQRLADDRRKS